MIKYFKQCTRSHAGWSRYSRGALQTLKQNFNFAYLNINCNLMTFKRDFPKLSQIRRLTIRLPNRVV